MYILVSTDSKEEEISPGDFDAEGIAQFVHDMADDGEDPDSHVVILVTHNGNKDWVLSRREIDLVHSLTSKRDFDEVVFYEALDEYGDIEQSVTLYSNGFDVFPNWKAAVGDRLDLLEIPERLSYYIDEDKVKNDMEHDGYHEMSDGRVIRWHN